MTPLDQDESATRIVRGSRIVMFLDAVARRVAADARTSRTQSLVHHVAAAIRTQPPRSRRGVLVVMAIVALGGHLLMASTLPVPSRPVAPLTAVAGLGAILATAEAIARSR